MPLKASGSLYSELPKLRELYERMEILELTDPGSMTAVRSEIETLRQQLLLGNVERKELPKIEVWAGKALAQIHRTIQARDLQRTRILRRSRRLN